MFSRGDVAALCGVAFTLCAASANADQRPRATYQWADPSLVDVAEPQAHSSNVIFLNRCEGGCTIRPGWDDSRTDSSSIVNQTVNIDAFAHGDAAWDSIVRCVSSMYEPFGVVVTDEDPGTAPHFEAIVAGRPANIGASGIGGVSPFSCGVINNAITYSFANIYGSVQDICQTVAQETAHAFGLEHEYLCEDPMTYLTGCGAKTFHDTDASCGEFSPRGCDCGGSTQNSFQALIREFDAGGPTPPSIELVKPHDGDLVQPGFVVQVDADDNVGIEMVSIWMNDELVAESDLPPFVFNAPETLPDGLVTVRVRVTDNRGEATEKTISVHMGDPCTDDSCADSQVCLGGRCVAGPSDPGGLGAVCSGNDDCDSGMCGSNGSEMYCSSPCVEGTCPGGFECLMAGAQSVCWPSDQRGGCRAAGGADGAAGGIGICALVLFACCLLLGRRRSKEVV